MRGRCSVCSGEMVLREVVATTSQFAYEVECETCGFTVRTTFNIEKMLAAEVSRAAQSAHAGEGSE